MIMKVSYIVICELFSFEGLACYPCYVFVLLNDSAIGLLSFSSTCWNEGMVSFVKVLIYRFCIFHS